MPRSAQHIAARCLVMVIGCGIGGSAFAAPTFPRLNEVYAKSGHNSYFSDNVVELFATGQGERISDQLLHDHTGLVEIDIHKGAPGKWKVYHTTELPGNNTQCRDLDTCFARMQAFQWALPQHEVVIVHLELKETAPVLIGQPTNPVFDGEHTIAQLDATIRRWFGAALFAPADFLARCGADFSGTLQECAAAQGWPTIDQLRGKFIVTIAGNFSTNHQQWALYATEGEGVRARAGFPLRSVFGADGNGQLTGGPVLEGAFPAQPIEPGVLQRARDASIFWETTQANSEPIFPETTRFLEVTHGIVRTIDSFSDLAQQSDIKAGYHYIQTEFLWSFVDDEMGAPTSVVKDPSRRFYDPSWVDKLREPSDPRRRAPLDRNALLEPGNRIYLSNFSSAEGSFRFELLPSSSTSSWEAVVSSSGIDLWHPSRIGTDGWDAARGNGCLQAAAADGSEWIRLCRRLNLKTEAAGRVADDPSKIYVSVDLQSRIAGRKNQTFESSRDDVSDNIGDMLRLTVANSAGGASVVAECASHLRNFDVTGIPAYRRLYQARFAKPLVKQGLYAEGDKLFVRPRLTSNAATHELVLKDLDGFEGNTRRSAALDFSVPDRGTPILPPAPAPDTAGTCKRGPPVVAKPSSTRGVGVPISSCGADEERSGALCYPRCREGYSGVGPVCWQRCPEGFTDDGATCRKDDLQIVAKRSYGRGVGGVPGGCPAGQERSGALCYPVCKPGYSGSVTECLQQCPPGYADDLRTCRRDASIIGVTKNNCPWYDTCGVVSAKGCATCPTGYTKDVCTCRRDAHIFLKSFYSRGAGSLLTCSPGQESDAGLCYPRCQAGYRGVGPVCWEDCPPGFNDDGATCRRGGVTIIAKDSYGRGVGSSLKCTPEQDYDAGLCYNRCDEGYEGLGPVCYLASCPDGYSATPATCECR